MSSTIKSLTSTSSGLKSANNSLSRRKNYLKDGDFLKVFSTLVDTSEYEKANQKFVDERTLQEKQDALREAQAQQDTLIKQLETMGKSEKDADEVLDSRNWIQKLFNIDANKGIVGQAFELLQRPANMVKGALVSSLGAKDYKGTVTDALVDGITGDKEFSFNDLKLSDGLATAIKVPLSMGFEVLADPLSYMNLPLKYVSKNWIKPAISKALGSLEKSLIKTEGGTNFVKQVTNLFDKLSDTIKTKFGLWKDTKYSDTTLELTRSETNTAIHTKTFTPDKNGNYYKFKDGTIKHIDELKDMGEMQKRFNTLKAVRGNYVQQYIGSYTDVMNNLKAMRENIDGLWDAINTLGADNVEDLKLIKKVFRIDDEVLQSKERFSKAIDSWISQLIEKEFPHGTTVIQMLEYALQEGWIETGLKGFKRNGRLDTKVFWRQDSGVALKTLMQSAIENTGKTFADYGFNNWDEFLETLMNVQAVRDTDIPVLMNRLTGEGVVDTATEELIRNQSKQGIVAKFKTKQQLNYEYPTIEDLDMQELMQTFKNKYDGTIQGKYAHIRANTKYSQRLQKAEIENQYALLQEMSLNNRILESNGKLKGTGLSTEKFMRELEKSYNAVLPNEYKVFKRKIGNDVEYRMLDKATYDEVITQKLYINEQTKKIQGLRYKAHEADRLQKTIIKIGNEDLVNKQDILSHFLKEQTEYLKNNKLSEKVIKLNEKLETNDTVLNLMGFKKASENYGTYNYKYIKRSNTWYNKMYDNVEPIIKGSNILDTERVINKKLSVTWQDFGSQGIRAKMHININQLDPMERFNLIGYLSQKGIISATDLPLYNMLNFSDMISNQKLQFLLNEVGDRLFVNLAKKKDLAIGSFIDFGESIPSGFSGQLDLQSIDANLGIFFEDILQGKTTSSATIQGIVQNVRQEYAFNNIAQLYAGKEFAAYNKLVKNQESIKRLTKRKNKILNDTQSKYSKQIQEIKYGKLPSLDAERQTLYKEISDQAKIVAKQQKLDSWKGVAKTEIQKRIVEQKNYIQQVKDNYLYKSLNAEQIKKMETDFARQIVGDVNRPWLKDHWNIINSYELTDRFENYARYVLRNSAPGQHGTETYKSFEIWKKQVKTAITGITENGVTKATLGPKDLKLIFYKKISQDYNTVIANAQNSVAQLNSVLDTIDNNKFIKGIEDLKIDLDRKVANSNALGMAEYQVNGERKIKERLRNIFGDSSATQRKQITALGRTQKETKQLNSVYDYYNSRDEAVKEIQNQIDDLFDIEVDKHIEELKTKNPKLTKKAEKEARETFIRKNYDKFVEKKLKGYKKNGFERTITKEDGTTEIKKYSFDANKNVNLDDQGYIKNLGNVYDLSNYDVFQDALNNIFNDGWFGTDYSQALSKLGFTKSVREEILRRKTNNLLLGGWQDVYNKSIKMYATPASVNSLDKLTNKHIQDVVKNLVMQKQGMVVKAKEFFKSNYGIDVQWLDIEGYLRHLQDTGEMFMNNIKGIEGASGQAARTAYQVGGNTFKKANMARTNLGTATDINRTYGYDLFQTDPVTSIALGLEMTEREVKLVHAFETMSKNGMVQTVTRDALISVGDDLAKWRKIQEDVAKFGKSDIADWEKLLKERDNYLDRFGNLDIMRYLQDKKLIDIENIKEWQILNEQVYNTFKQVGDILEASHIQGLSQNFEKMLDDLIIHSTKGGISIVHKSVPEIISRFARPIQDANIKDILSTINRYFVKPWKGLATMSMGFHLRNTVTNIMNANLAGFGSFDTIKESGKSFGELQKLYGKNGIMKIINDDYIRNPQLWNSVEKQAIRVNQLLDANPEMRALWNDYMDMYEKGIIGNNLLKEDTLTFLQKIKADATRTPFYNAKLSNSQKGLDKVLASYKKTYSKFSEFMMHMSKQTDDAFKVALYRMSKSEKYTHLKTVFGKSMTDEKFVKFVLFDYADLTSFETNIMKTVFPFYTWAKKNMMFHMKNIMVNSKRYTHMYDLLQGWRRGFVESDEELEYMQNYIPIWRENGKVMYVKITTPFLEMSNMLDGTALINMLNPIIKAPLEAITGFDFFTRKTLNNPALGVGLGFGGLFKTAGLAFQTLMGNYAPSYEDKRNAGMIGNKILGFSNSLSWLIGTNRQKRLGGQNENIDTIANLFPSIFSTMDATAIKLQNIKNRNQELQDAINYFKKYYGLGTGITNTGLDTNQLLSYYK